MPVHDRYKNFISDQRTFFDQLITEDWNSYKNSFWDFTRSYEVKKINSDLEPNSVLNVGCGCGFHDLEFSKYNNVKSVVGIDYSAKSIHVAEQEYPHNKIKRYCFDIMEETSHSSLGTFDLVTSFQVIEHIERYKEFFQNLIIKTSSGGHIAIATPNRKTFANLIRTLFNKPTQFCDPMHFKEFSKMELRHLGESLGLQFEQSWGYGFSFNVVWHLDKFFPNKFLFFLGRLIPQYSNVIVIIFRKP